MTRQGEDRRLVRLAADHGSELLAVTGPFSAVAAELLSRRNAKLCPGVVELLRNPVHPRIRTTISRELTTGGVQTRPPGRVQLIDCKLESHLVFLSTGFCGQPVSAVIGRRRTTNLIIDPPIRAATNLFSDPLTNRTRSARSDSMATPMISDDHGRTLHPDRSQAGADRPHLPRPERAFAPEPMPLTHATSKTSPVPATHDYPATLGALRDAGYTYRPVKQELRDNALRALALDQPLFPGIVGYDDTVLPQVVQAILSGHDILLLGLRGQAKTRILRSLTNLLDPWIPIVDGPGLEIPDDPMHPTTARARQAIAEMGDDTPVSWLHRSRRYHEKLATPDVTIADLIGEIDLIKHAEGRYLSDEATMHFGLVPRSKRGLFVINELPDLAPRIQVGLFNVLEERDIQIRGYPIRLELDLALMFSANPEDYTNRGRIVTPLKDRIGSVVRTHYPMDNGEAMRITRENAFAVNRAAGIADAPSDDAHAPEAPSGAFANEQVDAPPTVVLPDILHEILEEMIRQARHSPHVNQASGVSVRAAIAMLECVISAAEVRAVRSGETSVTARVCDVLHLAAACRGKIELMLSEDASDGTSTEDRLIDAFFGEALKSVIGRHVNINAIESLAEPFNTGVRLELDDRTTTDEVVATLKLIPGLLDAAQALARAVDLDDSNPQNLALTGELLLEFLYVNNRLSKVTRPGTGGSGVAYTG